MKKKIIKKPVSTKIKIKVKKTSKAKSVKKAEEKDLTLVGLHMLKCPKGAHKKKRILGRGESSGHGKTSTRGSKGQTSRAGRDMYLGFEGGQTPLIRRIPKRGFTNLAYKKVYQIVNLENIAKLEEQLVSLEILKAHNLIKDELKLVKILGEGEFKGAKTIQAHAFSRKAQEKIKASGGKFEVLNV